MMVGSTGTIYKFGGWNRGEIGLWSWDSALACRFKSNVELE